MLPNTINPGPAKESSVTSNYKKTVIFIINRNGLDEEELCKVIEKLLDDEYAAPDAQVEWVSTFGAYPERPHAFITISNDELAEEMISNETGSITFGEKTYNFEFQAVLGLTPSQYEDPLCVFISGVDTEIDEEEIEEELLFITRKLVEPKEIVFPRNWKETGNIIMTFYDADSASTFARVAKLFLFFEKMVKVSYARKRPEIRSSPPTHSNGRKSPNGNPRKSPNSPKVEAPKNNNKKNLTKASNGKHK